MPGDTTDGTLAAVDADSLARAAVLLGERNTIDAELARLIQRAMTSGHLGEWIAAQIFDIELEPTAVAAGIDGRFRSGPLQDRTVNIKWYLKREGLLDTMESPALDYYLVLTGPPSAASSSRGTIRPWCIEAVFLFDARQLRSEQIHAGSEAGRCLQRHQAAVGSCRNLPVGRQPSADRNLALGGATQAIRPLTASSPVGAMAGRPLSRCGRSESGVMLAITVRWHL